MAIDLLLSVITINSPLTDSNDPPNAAELIQNPPLSLKHEAQGGQVSLWSGLAVAGDQQ